MRSGRPELEPACRIRDITRQWLVATKTSILQASSSRTTRSRRCPRARSSSSTSTSRAGPLAAGRAVLLRHAKLAPSSPGVYRMLDAAGEVLYVGKAKNIRKRITSYTRPTGHDTRIERVIAGTAAVEFVTTATETEALLLEANLIKRLRPRFNVLLRDDKSFPYIIITSDHWAPQILKHRGARSRQGSYYGPFASVWAVNRTITALAARVPAALLLGRLLRKPDAAVPAASDQALLGALHQRDRFRRIRRAGARGQRVSLRQEPGGARRAFRRDGEGVGRARLRARRDLPRPARRAVGDAIDARHQSALDRGGRRVRHPSGGRLQRHRGVLLPHRTELGQPRLFPQGRSHARAGRGAGRVPRRSSTTTSRARPRSCSRTKSPSASCWPRR